MKTRILLLGLTLALAHVSRAGLYYDGTGGVIPDGSPAGTTWQITSTDVGAISSVSVVLNVSGGFNGDLYAYLAYNDSHSTRTAILLNHIGGGSSAASGSGLGSVHTMEGYPDLLIHGIRLMDGGQGGNVHSVTPGEGTHLTPGDYAPDSAVTFSATFGNMNAGGTWTLFFADTSPGDQSTLVSWGLDLGVTAVPEPVNVALGLFGLALLLGSLVRRQFANRICKVYASPGPVTSVDLSP
jgi:hypothetical protein